MVDKKYQAEAKVALQHLKEAQYALKTGVFKWSKDYDLAATKYEAAGKAFKEINDDESAAEAYLNFAKCSEHTKSLHMAADGYAECARLLPVPQWRTAYQYLQQADVYYKTQGFQDRGFTLTKRFAAELCDSENSESVSAGLKVYQELFPKLFEDDNMTMNYDMLETYPKALAKAQKWLELIEAKKRIIKYYRDIKRVDHMTRRSFIEIISVQIILEDFYKIDDSLQDFFKEVGGNPYEHDEYEICDKLNSSVEKKDWEALEDVMRKPLFGFIEIEIVKALKKWVKSRPAVQPLIADPQIEEPKKVDEKEALDDLLC